MGQEGLQLLVPVHAGAATAPSSSSSSSSSSRGNAAAFVAELRKLPRPLTATSQVFSAQVQRRYYAVTRQEGLGSRLLPSLPGHEWRVPSSSDVSAASASGWKPDCAALIRKLGYRLVAVDGPWNSPSSTSAPSSSSRPPLPLSAAHSSSASPPAPGSQPRDVLAFFAAVAEQVYGTHDFRSVDAIRRAVAMLLLTERIRKELAAMLDTTEYALVRRGLELTSLNPRSNPEWDDWRLPAIVGLYYKRPVSLWVVSAEYSDVGYQATFGRRRTIWDTQKSVGAYRLLDCSCGPGELRPPYADGRHGHIVLAFNKEERLWGSLVGHLYRPQLHLDPANAGLFEQSRRQHLCEEIRGPLRLRDVEVGGTRPATQLPDVDSEGGRYLFDNDRVPEPGSGNARAFSLALAAPVPEESRPATRGRFPGTRKRKGGGADRVPSRAAQAPLPVRHPPLNVGHVVPLLTVDEALNFFYNLMYGFEENLPEYLLKMDDIVPPADVLVRAVALVICIMHPAPLNIAGRQVTRYPDADWASRDPHSFVVMLQEAEEELDRVKERIAPDSSDALGEGGDSDDGEVYGEGEEERKGPDGERDEIARAQKAHELKEAKQRKRHRAGGPRTAGKGNNTTTRGRAKKKDESETEDDYDYDDDDDDDDDDNDDDDDDDDDDNDDDDGGGDDDDEDEDGGGDDDDEDEDGDDDDEDEDEVDEDDDDDGDATKSRFGRGRMREAAKAAMSRARNQTSGRKNPRRTPHTEKDGRGTKECLTPPHIKVAACEEITDPANAKFKVGEDVFVNSWQGTIQAVFAHKGVYYYTVSFPFSKNDFTVGYAEDRLSRMEGRARAAKNSAKASKR